MESTPPASAAPGAEDSLPQKPKESTTPASATPKAQNSLPQEPKGVSEHIWLLYKAKELNHDSFDIVFVHGLQQTGDNDAWQKTWSSRPNKKSDSSVCWPAVWLPRKFPHANVYSIKYDACATEWCSKPQDLEDLSHNLAQELAYECGSRPLVLVGHSLGGLVIKNILSICGSQAPDNEGFLKLQKSVCCCFWYGVPHLGAPLAATARIDERLEGFLRFAFQTIGKPTSLVADLKPLTKYLTRLQSSYVGIRGTYNFYNYYFAEVKPMFGMSEPVVPHWSAVEGADPLNWTNIEEDHVNICKPTRETDTSYLRLQQKIPEKVRSWIEKAEASGEARGTPGVISEDLVARFEALRGVNASHPAMAR